MFYGSKSLGNHCSTDINNKSMLQNKYFLSHKQWNTILCIVWTTMHFITFRNHGKVTNCMVTICGGYCTYVSYLLTQVLLFYCMKKAASCLLGLDEHLWRHQMETFSALLADCAGHSPISGKFPAQRPVTRSFVVFFDLRLNKRLSKQSWGWWFETPSRHYNVTVVINSMRYGRHLRDNIYMVYACMSNSYNT